MFNYEIDRYTEREEKTIIKIKPPTPTEIGLLRDKFNLPLGLDPIYNKIYKRRLRTQKSLNEQ